MSAVPPPAAAGRPGPRRGRPPTGRAGALLTLLAVLLAGCGSLGAAADVGDRSDLVTSLAGQLESSAALTYSAEYGLPGGARASIAQAQRPLRSAYTFPGGRITVTTRATTRCRTAPKVVCEVSAPPSPGVRPAILTTGAGRPAMVTAAEVAALLRASALDTDAVVEQHDTTVAGLHASCVQVRPAVGTGGSRFATCVTADGVLGSFEGPVGDQPVEVTMTRYRDTVDAAAFEPPDGATMLDRRTR